jgi:hypothetical protein
MRSLEHRRLSNSQPTTIPELPCSPPSPSDPGYSALAGYPSPVESDAVQTPCVEHLDRYDAILNRPGDCQIFRLHTHTVHSFEKGRKTDFAHGNYDPQKNPCPYPLDLSPVETHASPVDYGSPTGMSESGDDLVRSFSDAFIIGVDPPQYDASPIISIIPCPPRDLGGIQAEESYLSSRHNINAKFYSQNFPVNHTLNPHFVCTYALEDELGSGGYGFVMTARHRMEGYEVAIKFIIKTSVPEHAWMENDAIGRLPTEVVLLSFLEHENIVKCLDLFEDSLYFYLVRSSSVFGQARRLLYRHRFKSCMVHRGPNSKETLPAAQLLPYPHQGPPAHWIVWSEVIRRARLPLLVSIQELHRKSHIRRKHDQGHQQGFPTRTHRFQQPCLDLSSQGVRHMICLNVLSNQNTKGFLRARLVTSFHKSWMLCITWIVWA